jgi:acyl-CoA thioester hydrolase
MEQKDFSRAFAVRWADLDTNGHLRYSVYLDYAVDTQFRSLENYGYTAKKLLEMGFGPIILRMETRYSHEVTVDETVTDSFKLAGLSPDGARWLTRHDILKLNGKTAATIKLEGVWLNIHTRQAIAPPPDVLEIFNSLPRTENFETLRSFVRSKK